MNTLHRIISHFRRKPSVKPAGSEPGLGWEEQYLGGSEASESAMAIQWPDDVHGVQYSNMHKMLRKGEMPPTQMPGCPVRAFHVNWRIIANNAVFRVASNIPTRFQSGIFQPGAEYPVTLRILNAHGIPMADTKADLRGFAFRVHADEDQDFLLNNLPLHVRDAEKMMKFVKAEAGNKILFIPKIFLCLGVRDAIVVSEPP